ncbi:MAG TPA: hypothetical protein ENK04_10825 [Gammaproteobacteria bacterium]|nr:hypothetical protein [Gammaproteobacteria bacterium]
MPIIEKSILISASPEEVFAIIVNVENMSDLSPSIKKVTRISNNSYHWEVNLAGMALEWDAELLKTEKPKYLSWRSIRGIENCGEYVLEPQDGKTRLIFRMEYHLPSRVFEVVVNTFLESSFNRWLAEILSNLKKVIEKRRD